MTEATIAMAALAAIFAFLTYLQGAALRARVDSLAFLNAKLDALLKHAGITFDPFADAPPAVTEALRSGNKIEAIKRYREVSGAGLKEAKDFVEDLQRRAYS